MFRGRTRIRLSLKVVENANAIPPIRTAPVVPVRHFALSKIRTQYELGIQHERQPLGFQGHIRRGRRAGEALFL